jgi:hypothetical protein
VRYLFATLLTHESDFYGRVGLELARRGHDVSFVTMSRHSTRLLQDRGLPAYCMPELIAGLPPVEVAEEVERIESQYGLRTIREAYRTDVACEGKPEEWCIRYAVDHFRALERLLTEIGSEVIVPEVGCETIRIVTHHIGLDRGVPVLFLFYTIFPQPLRLYVNTMHAPIVPADELRALTPHERAELERFRREFTSRAQPIRPYRRVSLDPRRLLSWLELVRRKHRDDYDNPYLRPGWMLKEEVMGLLRPQAARLLYERRRPGRRFVYFPIHVADDYKIRRLIPHCADQAGIVEQIADALPAGYDLVLKEHPLSIGRNPLSHLRRLRARPNVRLVPPTESSHELIKAADAVAVISSTVGLEALLYRKPVLTLGRPFYAGYDITVDLDSFADIPAGVATLLRFRPDPERTDRFLHAAMRRCYPGAPVLVDASDENARTLAATLDEVGRDVVASRRSSRSAQPRSAAR